MIGSEHLTFALLKAALCDQIRKLQTREILSDRDESRLLLSGRIVFPSVQAGTFLRRTFSRPRSEPRKYSRSKANKIRRTYTMAAEKAAFADPKTL